MSDEQLQLAAANSSEQRGTQTDGRTGKTLNTSPGGSGLLLLLAINQHAVVAAAEEEEEEEEEF